MKQYIIDTAEKININNNDYYLRFRSQNSSNPIVLFLHGGCGAANRPFIMKWNSELAEYWLTDIVCINKIYGGYKYA
ncbi:MAG: hypothetical protein E7536_06805 [Ruminococcaceae bacterium]|nr:hypothetical protein [Oscillospiraceae bacterium]